MEAALAWPFPGLCRMLPPKLWTLLFSWRDKYSPGNSSFKFVHQAGEAIEKYGPPEGAPWPATGLRSSGFHINFILKEKILGNILDIFIYVFWLPYASRFPGQPDAFIFKSCPWFQDKRAVKNLCHHWMGKEIWKLSLLFSLESQITF